MQSSPRGAELHAFALLHLRDSQSQKQKEQQEVDRTRVCTALGQQLEGWHQQYHNLFQKGEPRHLQQLPQLPWQEIRKLLYLLDATAAAECSAIVHAQLHGVRADYHRPYLEFVCRGCAYRL